MGFSGEAEQYPYNNLENGLILSLTVFVNIIHIESLEKKQNSKIP